MLIIFCIINKKFKVKIKWESNISNNISINAKCNFVHSTKDNIKKFSCIERLYKILLHRIMFYIKKIYISSKETTYNKYKIMPNNNK